MTAKADTNPLREALEKICRVGKWTGTDGLEYWSTEGRIAEAALASEPVAGAVGVTDAMVDAGARELWNDRDARHGGPWDGRDPREVCVIQTKATMRAALQAALALSPQDRKVTT